MNKNIKNKNKILTIITIIIAIFFTTASIFALTNYFSKQRKEKIQLMNNLPFFTIERTKGNNEDKILIPLPIPNFKPSKYQHLIEMEHKAVLNTNGIEIDGPLYLKITSSYDTKTTFENPTNFFNLSMKVNNNEYDESQRPLMALKEGNGTITIQIGIEQKEIIKETIDGKKPELDLIFDYELVDSKGNSFSGGNQTIKTSIVQTA
ncbi:hypothetical protein CWO85_00870 [Candidatus Phytoplasma ziziphi]|uniref:Uncharacterized protein n=1 Tax=Ziziphus jujuba witches'-broom phytoplasma TaxID=135727 RepID=A0A660HM35_ZIZJU|nr:hypothetical protein [Candidatus Phytoplasma ziziphi]AYJ01090.1 hypothetical protein CWO85_00870 [Candidatus Phytoplasma ziziphi]